MKDATISTIFYLKNAKGIHKSLRISYRILLYEYI